MKSYDYCKGTYSNNNQNSNVMVIGQTYMFLYAIF